MANLPFSSRFKNVSIAKKLYAVICIVVVLLIIEVGTLFFAVNTLSSVRAFVGAEGLWSKAQKDAVYQLQKYHLSGDTKDKQAFYDFMQVPLGHHQALVELLQEQPDVAAAKQGLLDGGNHPDDIDGMIKLFRRFNEISYIKKSLHIWSEADSVVMLLIPVAEKLSDERNSASPSQNNLNAIIQEIAPINQRLTVLENDFSYTLGVGARWFEGFILSILLVIAVTVGLSGLLLTSFIVKGISSGLNEIMSASERIGNKDFSAKARVFANDEIGQLATSFNEMTAQLDANIKALIQTDRDLTVKTTFIEQNEQRISRILEALIKTTQLDFSEKLPVSDKGDEIDAIAVGLNTLSEELEYHLQQLTDSEEKLKHAQRLTKIGNWEMNMTTLDVQWSDELYNVYGYGNERFEVTFNKAIERMTPADQEKAKAEMGENVARALLAFKEHGRLEYENPPSFFTLLLPDGTTKVVQGMGKVILSPSGAVVKMLGTVQDITEKEIDRRKLRESNIELRRKNKDIEQFAYAASHDLQEPLRSISNFSKLLAKKLADNPDEDVKKYMNLISGGANRMSNLIFDLLAYARVGKDTSKSIINCNDLVHEITTDLSTLIEENDAEIQVEKLPELYCYDLKSVFQNLIINGIKFRRKDTSPVIHISVIETGTDFIFSVQDNGIGIEQKYSNRIFIIFQRLHTRHEYEGTGIGLSLCKKVIELNGGDIWVESEFGNGSTFHFTIPKNNANTL